MGNEGYFTKSYASHERHYAAYARGGSREDLSRTWLASDTVDAWRHQRMRSSLDPLLAAYRDARWLTVGDGQYGGDAQYIRQKGIKVMATDISDVLLKEAKELGVIDEYRKENAESLSFDDESFDFVVCKEAYHHFPRPSIALYEMLRVCSRGIVLIEPNDPVFHTTLLPMVFGRLKDLANILRGKEVVRHRFENSGNYVYALSKREIEKLALGVNCRTVAFKGMNDYYQEGVEFERMSASSMLFKRVQRRIRVYDLLTRIGLREPSVLVALILKNECDDAVRSRLKKAGYCVSVLPGNPWL